MPHPPIMQLVDLSISKAQSHANWMCYAALAGITHLTNDKAFQTHMPWYIMTGLATIGVMLGVYRAFHDLSVARSQSKSTELSPVDAELANRILTAIGKATQDNSTNGAPAVDLDNLFPVEQVKTETEEAK